MAENKNSSNGQSVLDEHELSALVAEKVMNCTDVSWQLLNEDETGSALGFEHEAQAREYLRTHPYMQRNYHVGSWKKFPLYARSIEAAMEVVEKIIAWGWSIQIRSHSKTRWEVMFAKIDHGRGEATERSLPEAICRAALQAMEQHST